MNDSESNDEPSHEPFSQRSTYEMLLDLSNRNYYRDNIKPIQFPPPPVEITPDEKKESDKD